MGQNYTAIATGLNETLEKARELQALLEAIPYPKMNPFKDKDLPLYKSMIQDNVACRIIEDAIQKIRLAQMYLQDSIAADSTLVDATQTIHQINS
jgi:hypothetical protein